MPDKKEIKKTIKWEAKKDELRKAEHKEAMKKFFGDKYKNDNDSWSVLDDEGMFIADCGVHPGSEKNAKLIAEVPKMIAQRSTLLDICIEVHDSLLCLHVCSEDRNFADKTREKLRDVISLYEDTNIEVKDND